ncbi:PIG-L family deacetylase [bacterium]|nr:PIG-L family deacetylase [bacterium]
MTPPPTRPIALAVGAHPDDIEFTMAGTLLLLKQAGYEIHLWNLCDGCGGTREHAPEVIAAMRWEEAQNAARIAGATIHPPLFPDLDIWYNAESVARVGAVVREIQPDVVLTQPYLDYLEDHQNTCRLVVAATFCRTVRNSLTIPSRPINDKAVALYHGMPHGLVTWDRTPARPGCFVNITSVLPQKQQMLAQHRSQKEWLDVSQGMDSYLAEMEGYNRRLGKMTGRFEVAEGFWQHSHLGFGPEDLNPLQTVLGEKYLEAAQSP